MGDNSGARQGTDSPEVTVITGGSSGIGAATAQRFAAAGSHVVLAARRQQPLSELATELETDEVETLAVPTDVTDPDDVAALFEATLDHFGRLDTVVVNAGTGEGRQIPLGGVPH
ncbi:MAG: short-chain dehydrogenase [uncultured archaeon A07HR60]|nr:MAG: short-chain dehydrogenase [uncultured archaeon A07HR60]